MSSRLNETWTYGDLEQKQKLQRLVFPSGIGYDKQNNRVRTKRVNSIFSSIPLLSRDLAKIKSGEPVDFNQFSARVTLSEKSSNFSSEGYEHLIHSIKEVLNYPNFLKEM